MKKAIDLSLGIIEPHHDGMTEEETRLYEFFKFHYHFYYSLEGIDEEMDWDVESGAICKKLVERGLIQKSTGNTVDTYATIKPDRICRGIRYEADRQHIGRW